jgi:hypothetical protein
MCKKCYKCECACLKAEPIKEIQEEDGIIEVEYYCNKCNHYFYKRFSLDEYIEKLFII